MTSPAGQRRGRPDPLGGGAGARLESTGDQDLTPGSAAPGCGGAGPSRRKLAAVRARLQVAPRRRQGAVVRSPTRCTARTSSVGGRPDPPKARPADPRGPPPLWPRRDQRPRPGPPLGAVDEVDDPGDNPVVADSGLDPLGALLAQGWRELRRPRADFDVWWNWTTYLDPSREDANPFVHWVREGRRGLAGLPTARERNRRPPSPRARRLCLFAAFDRRGGQRARRGLRP